MLDCTSPKQFSTLQWPSHCSLWCNASSQATSITTLSKSRSFTCILWGIILFLCWPAVPSSLVMMYLAAARVFYGNFKSLLLMRSCLGVYCEPWLGFCRHRCSWDTFSAALKATNQANDSGSCWVRSCFCLSLPPSQPSIALAGWGRRSLTRFPWRKLPQVWSSTHTHQLPLLNPSKSFCTTVNIFTIKECILTSVQSFSSHRMSLCKTIWKGWSARAAVFAF